MAKLQSVLAHLSALRACFLYPLHSAVLNRYNVLSWENEMWTQGHKSESIS